jgi:hypothetical protein
MLSPNQPSRADYLSALAIITIGIAFHATAAPPVSSTFDVDEEGWVVKDLFCSNYGVVNTYAVTWHPTGGHPGGYISAIDPSTHCFFFDAPVAYLGDQSSRIGGSLQFSIRTDLNNWEPGSVMLLVGNGGQVLLHSFAHPDEDIWQVRTVPLNHIAFNTSEATFAAVMSNLEALRISGEFGAVIEETSDLDSVCMRSANCLADITCSGVVNVSDLLQLLAAWGPCPDCPADLNGDGIVNVSDLLQLLSAWGPCPL